MTPPIRAVLLAPNDSPLIDACLAVGVDVIAAATTPSLTHRLATRLQPELLIVALSSAVHPDRRADELALTECEEGWPVVLVGHTAEDAVSAFQAGALGFTLGDDDELGLRRAVDRAVATAQRRQPTTAVRLVLRDGSRSLVLQPSAISWIEAAGNYVRVHGDHNHRLVRCTLQQLESRLDPRQFARIHRSAVVNLDRVAMVEPSGREAVALLRDGTRLTVSRAHRRNFNSALGGT